MHLSIKKAPGGYSYTIGKGENAVTGWSTCADHIKLLCERYARRRYEDHGLTGDTLKISRRSRGMR
jgi:hypothetical protein